MDKHEFNEFMEAQRREIARHRWIASEKAGRDLGQEAALDWVKNHAEEFRVWWEDEKKNTKKASGGE
jgi:hypothetical protein